MKFGNKNLLTAFERRKESAKFRSLYSQVALVLLLAGILYVRESLNFEKPVVSGAEAQEPVLDTLPLYSPELQAGFDAQSLNLTARAFLVYEEDSNRVIMQNEPDMRLPVASLTKLSTALLISRSLSPQTVVQVPENLPSLNLPSPVLGLRANEEITVGSLVEGMLVASANDAAAVLEQALGGTEAAVMALNDLAVSLGLANTNFANLTGLDSPQAFSSARDLLNTVFEVQRIPWIMSLLSETKGVVSSVDGKFVHRFNTTNRLLRDNFPGVVAGKTGFTDEARGNLVVFAKSPVNSRIIAVLLGSENREEEMSRLLSFLRQAYKWQ